MDPEILARLQALLRAQLGPYTPPEPREGRPGPFRPAARGRFDAANPRLLRPLPPHEVERQGPGLPPEGPNQFVENLKDVGSFLRNVVDPTQGRGIFGFGRDVIEEIQRRPIASLTPVGDVEAIQEGRKLATQHPVLGAGLEGLGYLGALPVVGGMTAPVRRAAMRKLGREGIESFPRAIPAFKNPQTGEVVIGPTHPTILNEAWKMGEPLDDDVIVSGFVDRNTGDFVERSAAQNLLRETDVGPGPARAERVPGHETVPVAQLDPEVQRGGATGQGIRRVQRHADDYVAATTRRGVTPRETPIEYEPVPIEEAYAVADLYPSLPHAPDNPIVQDSYRAFADETMEQFEFLQGRGVKFVPVKEDPYANSAELLQDVQENNQLKFFLTDLEDFAPDHPLAQQSGVTLDGQPLVYNDVFRAVHDYFGHAAEGFQFGPRGEHNAWRKHVDMYSPMARPAMSFETRGQNSWVNYRQELRTGPEGTVPGRGEPGFTPLAERGFAEQKANVLPYELSDPNAGFVERRAGGPPVPGGLRAGDPAAEALAAEAQQAVGQGVVERARQLDPYFAGGPDPVTALKRQEILEEFVPVVRELPERPQTARAAAGARLRRDSRSQAAQARRREAIEAGLTPEELAEFRGSRADVVQRIEENYSKLPDPVTFAHAAIRGARAFGWYRESGAQLKDMFGEEAPRVAALLAAQSPQKSVKDNVRATLQTLANWNAAGRPTDRDAIIEILDEVRDLIPSSDYNNSVRALTATAEDLAQLDPKLLSGEKVGPFYANLGGSVNPIVNDTHMARGYGTDPQGVGSKGRRLAQNAMVRNAAQEFQRITGQAVDPRELQEMSWAYIRGLTNAAGEKGSALEAIEQSFLDPDAVFAGGQTVNQRIEASAPIGELLADPEFELLLERIGVEAPGARPPTGIEGLDPSIADINALRDIAERIDIVRGGGSLYSAAPAGLFGIASARERLERERQGR